MQQGESLYLALHIVECLIWWLQDVKLFICSFCVERRDIDENNYKDPPSSGMYRVQKFSSNSISDFQAS